jgi:hypothetical protein
MVHCVDLCDRDAMAHHWVQIAQQEQMPQSPQGSLHKISKYHVSQGYIVEGVTKDVLPWAITELLL